MTRDTTPVCRTPLAITSIAAMVITPPLLNPAKSCAGVAIPISPATTNAQMSANTAGTLPVVITTSVAMTITAATTAMQRLSTHRQSHCGGHVEHLPDIAKRPL